MASAPGANAVLVHGGFVSVVQNPTLSLAGDVAATKLILAAQGRPVILVGHSVAAR